MNGRTDICRNKNKAEILLRAIANKHCKYFKVKHLRIPDINHRELSCMIPLLKEKHLVIPRFNKHCYTYERLFSPSDIESIIQGLGG